MGTKGRDAVASCRRGAPLCGLVSSAGEGKSATLQATPVSLAELKVLVDAEKTSLAEAKAKLAVDVVLLDAEKERFAESKAKLEAALVVAGEGKLSVSHPDGESDGARAAEQSGLASTSC